MKNSVVLFFLSTLLVSCTTLHSLLRKEPRRPRRKVIKPKKPMSLVKKKIALLTFLNEAPVGGDDLGVIATEELRKELSRTGGFIIDPMGKRIFGSSKEIYTGGGKKLLDLSRKARVSGLNFVIFGRIIEAKVREQVDEIGIMRKTKSYTEAKVEIRVFDVNSNKEIYSDTVKGYADDQTHRFYGQGKEDFLNYRRDLLRYGVKVAARRAIPQVLRITSKLDWVGRVAKIIGTKIYVNAGRLSGIQLGDILKIVTEGAEVFDPETGALIGISNGQVKGTIEIIDYFGPDGATAILHSGGSVLEGDFVQLY